MARFIHKGVAWYLVAAMFIIGIAPRAHAGLAPSEMIGLSPAERADDLRKVQGFLEMKMVRERLKDLGFSPEEIQARLTQLGPEQVHQLALRVDELNVGGDSGLGVVIALLVIAILVIILIQLLGHRVVIKK